MSTYDKLDIRLFCSPYSFLGLALPNNRQCHSAGLFNCSTVGEDVALEYIARTRCLLAEQYREGRESTRVIPPPSKTWMLYHLSSIRLHLDAFRRQFGDA